VVDDKLESWLSTKPHELTGGKTLGKFWQRLRKQKST